MSAADGSSRSRRTATGGHGRAERMAGRRTARTEGFVETGLVAGIVGAGGVLLAPMSVLNSD